MGVNVGPNLVTDGLVLCLDKYNDKSYLGEPTTNLISNGDFETNTVVWGPNQTATLVHSHQYNGRRCLKATMGQNTSTPGVRINGIAVLANTNYRMTALMDSGDCPYIAMWNQYPSASVSTTVTGSWSQQTMTFNTGAYTSLNVFFYTSGMAIGDSFYVDEVQLEVDTGRVTKFVNGTRSATDGWRDLSGNDNHADLTQLTYSATNVPAINSEVNDFSFDGTDDRVISDNHSIISDVRGDFSVGMWLKFGGTPSAHHIPFWISDSNGYGFLYIEVGSTYGYLGAATETKARNGYVSGANINDNNWHYIVVTRSTGASVVIYKDGVSQTVTANDMYGSWNTGSGGDMSVGVGMDNGSVYGFSYYGGSYSSLAIYNKVLTATEILQNFNAHKGRYGL